MNSIKSTITILFLLGVSYGVYRLIHTPDPSTPGTSSFFVATGTPSPGAMTLNPTADLPMRTGQNSSGTSAPMASNAMASPTPPKIMAPTLAPAPPPLAIVESKTNPALPAEIKPPAMAASQQSPNANLIPSTPGSTESKTVSGLSPITGALPGQASNLATMSGPLTPVGQSDSKSSQADLGGGALPSLRPTPNSAPGTSAPANALASAAVNAASPAATSADIQDLKSVWPIVDAQMRKGEIAESLQLLSGYYHANLSEADRIELLKWLDALAFKVIYSTEHRLSATPHVVKAGETIESIAKDWNVPADLISNINRGKIPPNNVLTPGLELKIVRGPFRAEIDSQRRELTLFLDRSYAGRFAIDTSKCSGLKTGQVAVQKLEIDPSGKYRMELTGGCCLIAGGSSADPNAIQMDVADAKDVFGILSANSPLTVIR